MVKLEKLMIHLEFGKILLTISIASILLTLLMHFIVRKYRQYRVIKYLPGFIFTAIGLYSLSKMGIELPDANEFHMILATTIFFVGGLMGLFSGLIIGIITKEKKPKKIKSAKTKKATSS